MNSITKKMFLNAGKLLTGDVIASILGVFTLVAMTRTMQSAHFGKWVFIQGIVLLISGVFSFQSWQMLIKQGAAEKTRKNSDELSNIVALAFTLDLVGAAFSYLVLLGILLFLLHFGMLEAEQQTAFFIYSLSALLNIQGMATGVLRLYNHFSLFSVSRVTGAALRALLIQVLITKDIELSVIATVWLVSEIFERVILNGFAAKVASRQGIHFTYDWRAVMRTFHTCHKFVFQTTIQTGIRSATDRIDVVILGALLGYTALAQYRVLRQVGQIVSKLVSPFYKSIYPELIALVDTSQKETLFKVVLQIILIFGSLSLLVILPLMFWGDTLISAVLGKEYMAPPPSLSIYTAGLFVPVVLFPLTPLLIAHGKTTQTLVITIVSSTAYLLMLVLFTVNFSFVGAVTAYLLYYLIWAAMSVRATLRLANQ